MRRRLAKLLLAVVVHIAAVSPAWAEDEVVLVIAEDSPITELTALEIRKAYLGINVAVGDQSIRAFRLNNDERLNQVFMQSVIAMTERSYERRLLSLTLKYGRPRPAEVDSPTELVAELSDTPLGIGYMWRKDAEKYPQLLVLRVLWQAH